MFCNLGWQLGSQVGLQCFLPSHLMTPIFAIIPTTRAEIENDITVSGCNKWRLEEAQILLFVWQQNCWSSKSTKDTNSTNNTLQVQGTFLTPFYISSEISQPATTSLQFHSQTCSCFFFHLLEPIRSNGSFTALLRWTGPTTLWWPPSSSPLSSSMITIL